MMKRIYTVPAFAALLGLTAAGCQSVAPLSPRLDSVPLVASEQLTHGRVSIRVVWPQAVQALPTHTRAIVVKTYRKGQLVSTETIVRENGQSIGSTVLRLPAGDGYVMEALAYAVETPADHHAPIAMGSSAIFSVETNRVTQVPLALKADNRIYDGDIEDPDDDWSWDYLGPGQWLPVYVEIDTEVPPSKSDRVDVYFGDVKSPEVRRATVDSYGAYYWAMVPKGLSGSQDIRLGLNGFVADWDIGSVTILERLSAERTNHSLEVGSSIDLDNEIAGHYYDSRWGGYDYTWLDYPSVTWKSSDPSTAFVTQNGQIYGLKPGQVTITACSGVLELPLSVTVNAKPGTADFEVSMPTHGSGSATMPIELPAYGGGASGTIKP